MALIFGDPVPQFRAPGVSNPNYAFDTAAGRYVVLALVSGPDAPTPQEVRALIEPQRLRFDDQTFCFYGMVADTPENRAALDDELPGVRWLFGDAELTAQLGGDKGPVWHLIDPMMRILASTDHANASRLLEGLANLPPTDRHGGPESFAPVLVAPRIFEPAFCQTLIEHYEKMGGEPSGFMREVDGVTKLLMDPSHKKRSDVNIEDEALKQQCMARIRRRLVPQIHKAFQYTATRMERYLIARYASDTGGYFKPHRDNTTKGTAHRRFAVSINLNQDFEGGDLRFPEFGRKTYRPPLGGAVVFSCSLLHEATAVTKGRRYAFLPFLYDEQAARVRAENLKFVDPAVLGRPAEEPAPAA